MKIPVIYRNKFHQWKTLIRKLIMENRGLDGLFEIIRQHELHIQTLQLLLELVTAMMTRPHADLMDHDGPLERKILAEIDKAVELDDPQLVDSVRQSMSALVVEFFNNVRRASLPRSEPDETK